MENFEFYAPTRMIFGKDSHLKVGDIIKGYGFKKILLHYGKGSVKKSGLYDEVVNSLKTAKIDYVDFGGVEPNPKLSLVKKGVELCKKNSVEMVLAVGGGSVIDSAKLIAIAALSQHDPWKFVVREAPIEKALPIGTILTISASGSEMSNSCVITNEDGWLKRGFGSDFNRPLFSICNPCLTFTVSPYQTACGIVDIMMHTIERYFTTSTPVMITDEIAEGLLRTVIKSGEAAMKNPCDYDARANLMWAGSVSHNGITGAGTAFMMICHQLEHELSGRFDSVSHGAGLSVIFPAWAKYIYKHNVKRFYDFAVKVWGVPEDFGNTEEIALKGILKCEKYFSSIGMPVRLSELGIDVTGEDIDIMSEKCTNYGKRTLPDYIELGKNEISEIFKIAKEAEI